MLDRNFRVTLIITLKKLCYTHESTSSYPPWITIFNAIWWEKKVIGFYKHVTHTTHFWIGTFSRLPDGPNYIITKVEERRRDEIRILGLHGKKKKIRNIRTTTQPTKTESLGTLFWTNLTWVWLLLIQGVVANSFSSGVIGERCSSSC